MKALVATLLLLAGCATAAPRAPEISWRTETIVGVASMCVDYASAEDCMCFVDTLRRIHPDGQVEPVLEELRAARDACGITFQRQTPRLEGDAL